MQPEDGEEWVIVICCLVDLYLFLLLFPLIFGSSFAFTPVMDSGLSH